MGPSKKNNSQLSHICLGKCSLDQAGLTIIVVLSPAGSIASCSGRSVMCHEETIQVSLFANHVGLGLMLRGNTLPTEILSSPPFVGYLESNGSAERSVPLYYPLFSPLSTDYENCLV